MISVSVAGIPKNCCRTTQPSYAVFVAPIHPEDRPSVEQTIATAVAEKGQFQLEYRIVLPDATVKHLLSIGHPGMTEAGDLEYAGTVMDITERKRAEAEARQSERRYRELQQWGSFQPRSPTK